MLVPLGLAVAFVAVIEVVFLAESVEYKLVVVLSIVGIVAEVIVVHFVLQQQKLLVDFVVAAELELARVVVSVLGPDLAFAAAPALVHGSE